MKNARPTRATKESAEAAKTRYAMQALARIYIRDVLLELWDEFEADLKAAAPEMQKAFSYEYSSVLEHLEGEMPRLEIGDMARLFKKPTPPSHTEQGARP